MRHQHRWLNSCIHACLYRHPALAIVLVMPYGISTKDDVPFPAGQTTSFSTYCTAASQTQHLYLHVSLSPFLNILHSLPSHSNPCYHQYYSSLFSTHFPTHRLRQLTGSQPVRVTLCHSHYFPITSVIMEFLILSPNPSPGWRAGF